MHISLLQFIITLSGTIFFLFGIDLYKRRKATILHFLVFFGGGIVILFFIRNPNILNEFGNFFGLTRGADLIVYLSIIFLTYFTLFLLNKIENIKINFTSLIRELALEKSPKLEESPKNIKLNSNIIFVIPTYNEKPHILKSTLNKIMNEGYKNIILVDDGSKNDVKNMINKYKNIIYIKHLKNRGQGAALETGFEYIRRYFIKSKLKYIVTFDADGQHDIKDLPKFLNKFKKNKKLEIVLGSRFIKNNNLNMPFSKKIILFLGKLFTLFISGKYFSDVHNGYRVLKKEVINKIRIENDGMTHASEIQDKIALNKINFIEIPVHIAYTEYSLGKGQKSSNAIKIGIEMIYRKFFFR